MRTAWNKGLTKEIDERVKLSKETKRKMSIAGLKRIERDGYSNSPEARKKISKALKELYKDKTKHPKYGTHLTQKQKRAISKSTKQSWKDGKFDGVNSPAYGHVVSEEAKRKIRLARAKQIITEETRRKISKTNKGRKISKEWRKKNSIALKKYYKEHPEAIEIIKQRRAKQIFPVKDTKIEIKIQKFLKQLGIDFFTHQYIKEIEHSYQCDILIPSMNIVIECDGDYWHKYPVGKDIDHIRTKELYEKGFKVLRLWECEIKEMKIHTFKTRLRIGI